jgi:hypothetical protein
VFFFLENGGMNGENFIPPGHSQTRTQAINIVLKVFADSCSPIELIATVMLSIEELYYCASNDTNNKIEGAIFIKVDSNFLLVLKIKCTKFHQDQSKTVDLLTKYTNKQTFSFIYIDRY